MSFAYQNGYVKLVENPQFPQSGKLAPVELETATIDQWSSGLCDCFSDTELCCLTCWLPWVTFGRIAEAVDEGETRWAHMTHVSSGAYIPCVLSGGIHALLTYLLGYGWKYSCIYRSKMRKKYNLDGSSFKDCLTHFFCETCALCQEYRELQSRGVITSSDDDHKIYGVEAVPVTHGGMTR